MNIEQIKEMKVANMLFTANPTLYTGGQVND